jgi:hypothetical protein
MECYSILSGYHPIFLELIYVIKIIIDRNRSKEEWSGPPQMSSDLAI